MTAEPVPVHACPICGDAGHLALLCRVDNADVFTCATCGADHVHPPPDARTLKAYYDRAAWFEGGEKGGYADYDAQTSLDNLEAVLAPFAGRTDLSILDVGCGYGTHLAAAAKRGWKCFGVEPSAHARKVARERLGGAAFIVENADDLIPHAFDIVLMLDVIEHLPAPYPTFYQLFSIGAITPKTQVVITTPNAGAPAAKRDPGAWPFRHPASHLTYYAPRALEFLLTRLHFTAVDIKEVGEGLIATARGSDFTEFMRERYVPGTWSKLAEYEHLPRYALAKTLAAGKTVLDFGCGTGYGAALMAEVAAQVTGLDIDAAALAWAAQSHHNPRLAFRRHDDLGASLPDKSFDLVTCFEMIEHVDHATQQAAVANMARLLRDGGMLVISTPNPAVTALYGENPYHIREMNEAQFRDLLGPHFPHITILRQYVRVGVAIDHDGGGAMTPGDLGTGNGNGAKPLAFLAVCSRAALPALPNRILFDQGVDFIAQFMRKEETLHRTRFEAYRRGEDAHSLHGQLNTTVQALKESQGERARIAGALRAKDQELQSLQRRRQEELGSPRFLARQLWLAMRARLKATLSGK